MTNGGQTVFDISSLTLLEFQNNNTIFDIDVHISGQYQAQDPTGLLTNPNYDYKKISSTAIQFAVAPVSGVLEFKLRTSDTMSFAQTAVKWVSWWRTSLVMVPRPISISLPARLSYPGM